MPTLRDEIDKIWSILNRQQARLKGLNLEKTFKEFFKKRMELERQPLSYDGLHLALCVDTRDPYKQNRIRFFSPIMDSQSSVSGDEGLLQKTKLGQCNWAWPVSSLGGFDDSGLCWVPPPGSTVCLLFQNNNPNTPFYIGTTWQRNKGPENAHAWNYDIPEYDKIFRGHRKGYMVGANDESQHLPSWNTDQYQGYDFDSTQDVDLLLDAGSKTTWPHIYGMSTPEKHRIKMDDGDPKCNRRWKRLEIMSSMGHYFLMKDDPYHHCGEWVNPKCKTSHVSITPDVCKSIFISMISGISVFEDYPCQQGPEFCSLAPEQYQWFDSPGQSRFDISAVPVEKEYLGNEHLCPGYNPFSTVSVSMPEDCLGKLRPGDFCFNFNNTGKNRYHKHQQECYPFLNDKCALLQSGMQLLSRGGHTLVFDDAVEEPRERPEWERTLNPFDMDGCTGVYKGRTFWRSSTGHFIELNDQEVNPKVRGPNNGINIVTASGNQVILNDHTTACCSGGPNRGIHIKSTSNHTLDFVDEQNKQCSPERDGCANPGPWSNKAFIRMRSGYGLTLLMNDAQSQTKTEQQYIQLMAPQTDNLQRGSHVLHMQERASGPGQIFLRAGGDYIVYSYDDMVEVVGDEKDNPSNKLEFVSNMKVVSVKDVYYNRAKTHCFWADDYIFLLAGKDCETGAGPGTCVFPVVVAHSPIPDYISQMCGIKASEHVFASAVNDAPGCASDLE